MAGGLSRTAGSPVSQAALCSILVAPAMLVGDEVARLWRRAVDTIVSRHLELFSSIWPDLWLPVTRISAWGAWIIVGLVAGLLALGGARLILRRPVSQPWAVIGAVLLVWSLVRLTVFDWTVMHRFQVAPLRLGQPMQLAPRPITGTVGFLAGLALGLGGASLVRRRHRSDNA